MTRPAASARPRVFLLRHGQSHANVQRLIASSPANARDAFGLTATGQEQVRRSIAAAVASGHLPDDTRLISSPLLRARESAAIAAQVLGVRVAQATVQIDERLSERAFGEMELGSDDQYERVWQADFADPSHERWGVESIEAVRRRASALLGELDATCVLCTHGDVASALLCAAAGLALGRHREVGALANGELRALPAEQAAATHTGLSGRARAG